jgi:hypothetical protein
MESPPSRVIYSIIERSALEGANRIDADFYQPHFVENDNFLQSLCNIVPVKTLKDVSDIRGSAFYGSIVDDYLVDHGVPFVRVFDIQDLTVSKEKLIYLPEGYEKFAKLNCDDSV